MKARNLSWAVTRLLLTTERRLTQAQASELLGVSQPSVASVMGKAKSAGWLDADGRPTRAGLAEWVDTYPGPGGLMVAAFGRGSLDDQVQRIASRCPDLVVSGVRAANQVAAWATSGRLTLYVPALPDVVELGLVEVDRISEATVVLHQPTDLSIFTCARARAGDGLRWADVLQAGVDLEGELADATRTLEDARRALLGAVG